MVELFSTRHGAFRGRIVHWFWIAAAAAGAALTVLPSSGSALLFVGAVLVLLVAWIRSLRYTVRRELLELGLARGRLERGEDGAAWQMATDLARHAKSRRVRNGALTTVAWAALKEHRPERAKEALDHIRPEGEVDLYCFAAVEDALGKRTLAIQALELEVSPSCESAKLLVDLCASQDRFDRAVLAAMARRDALGIENCRRVAQAALEAWALQPAATLASALFEQTGAPEDAAVLIRALAYQRNFAEVDRTTDEVLARLRAQGRASAASLLLAELSVDRRLPSGVCRELDLKLHAFEVR
jgi:hypothetical protein